MTGLSLRISGTCARSVIFKRWGNIQWLEMLVVSRSELKCEYSTRTRAFGRVAQLTTLGLKSRRVNPTTGRITCIAIIQHGRRQGTPHTLILIPYWWKWEGAMGAIYKYEEGILLLLPPFGFNHSHLGNMASVHASIPGSWHDGSEEKWSTDQGVWLEHTGNRYAFVRLVIAIRFSLGKVFPLDVGCLLWF